MSISFISVLFFFCTKSRLIVFLMSMAVSQTQTVNISSQRPQGQSMPLMRACPASGNKTRWPVMTCPVFAERFPKRTCPPNIPIKIAKTTSETTRNRGGQLYCDFIQIAAHNIAPYVEPTLRTSSNRKYASRYFSFCASVGFECVGPIERRLSCVAPKTWTKSPVPTFVFTMLNFSGV